MPDHPDLGVGTVPDVPTPSPTGEGRLLAVGDRIAAYPCTVTVERVGIAGATGRCDHCADEHVIDRHRYESGRGPWRPVVTARSGTASDG